MKKIKPFPLSVLIIFCLISCSNKLLPTSRSVSNEFDNPIAIANNTVRVTQNVLDAFHNMYGDVMDISWSLDKEKNYRVYFKKNDKIVRAAFNRRADFIYSISAYGQETLPADILYKVKETYFKKNIVSVIEVNISGKIAYMVNLEDKTSWLKIKVLNGEITEEGIYLKTT